MVAYKVIIKGKSQKIDIEGFIIRVVLLFYIWYRLIRVVVSNIYNLFKFLIGNRIKLF
jgi:hypothetical protein